jgi:hypothetical protein
VARTPWNDSDKSTIKPREDVRWFDCRVCPGLEELEGRGERGVTSKGRMGIDNALSLSVYLTR